jgi:hypothetical protein
MSAMPEPDPVAEALAEMHEAIQDADVHDDKLGKVLAALASCVRANAEIRDDIRRAMDEFAAKMAKVQQPFTREDIEIMNKGLAENGRAYLAGAITRLLHERYWRDSLLAATILVSMCAICLGLGHYWALH